MDAVRDTVVAAQFLEADPHRRLKLGHDVIRLAAEAVLDPFEPFYQTARKNGLINPAMPSRALRFVMTHFDNRQPDYFNTLQENLEAA